MRKEALTRVRFRGKENASARASIACNRGQSVPAVTGGIISATCECEWGNEVTISAEYCSCIYYLHQKLTEMPPGSIATVIFLCTRNTIFCFWINQCLLKFCVPPWSFSWSEASLKNICFDFLFLIVLFCCLPCISSKQWALT